MKILIKKKNKFNKINWFLKIRIKEFLQKDLLKIRILVQEFQDK